MDDDTLSLPVLPVKAKLTEKGENQFLKFGSSAMQGWRVSMEDTHVNLLSMPGDSRASFFGTYDGHGGSSVAQYAADHLCDEIVRTASYAKGDVEQALRDGFLALDQEMLKDKDVHSEKCGATATVILIKNGSIYCANAGDSRTVASVAGVAVPLSFDHKPYDDVELLRITAAHGWVESDRVDGYLALSRAFGDFVFKHADDKPPEEQMVTALPDVAVQPIIDDVEFVVIASDGVWDVLTNQEAVDFCRVRLAVGDQPEHVCEQLLDRCLATDIEATVGDDNMTVILVCLLTLGISWKEFVCKCARPRGPAPAFKGVNKGPRRRSEADVIVRIIPVTTDW